MKTKIECRVCLRDGGNIPIFGDDEKPDVSLEVTIFGSIQLSKDDEFTKVLCKKCFNLLENAISFRKSALQTDIVLQRRKQKGLPSQSSTDKLEADDDNEVTNANVSKPDFQKVKTTENISEIIDEYLSDDNLPDDGESDVDESKKDCNTIEKVIDFKCTICSLNFTSLKEYELHRTSIINCIKNCSKTVKKKKKNKVEQVKKKKLVKDKKCNECNKFFTENDYKEHVHNSRIPNKTKECPICKNLYKPKYYSHHKRIVHGQVLKSVPNQTVECPVCKKRLVSTYIKIHMKMHDDSDNRKYICDQCGKKCTFYSSFERHIAIHNNVLQYECAHCPYRGRSKQLLRIHLRTHTKDYRYKCSQCGVSCLTKSNLNRHILRHKGPVVSCESCDRKFYTKLELERHITVAHLGIKDHICNICGKAFGYSKGLRKHEIKVHKRVRGVVRRKPTFLKIQEEEIQKASEIA